MRNPDISLRVAFPVATVVRAAEELLERNRFDADKDASDEEEYRGRDSSDGDSSDDESDPKSDDEEEAYRRRKKIAKKVKKTRAPPVGHHGQESDDEEKGTWHYSRNRKAAPPLDEMEDLIKEMNSLSLKNPDYVKTQEYTTLWYRAISLDPGITVTLRTPELGGRR